MKRKSTARERIFVKNKSDKEFELEHTKNFYNSITKRQPN